MKLKVFATLMICSLFLSGCSRYDVEKFTSSTKDTDTAEYVDTAGGGEASANESADVETQPETAPAGSEEIATQPESVPEEKPEDTYMSNSYYDVIDSGNFVDSLGTTHIIEKVKAKQSQDITGTVIAYDSAGKVIGKSSSDIHLSAGMNNFFEYTFNNGSSIDRLEKTVKTRSSFLTGEENVVIMTGVSRDSDNLYLSLEQIKDNLGAFAKFKLLLLKDGKYVGTEEGYFSTYAENLTGKGSTDVAEIWVWRKVFDNVEYYYEP